VKLITKHRTVLSETYNKTQDGSEWNLKHNSALVVRETYT